MKRVLFSLLALSVIFTLACQPAENANGNANKSLNSNQPAALPAGLTDKIVQVFINDDPAKPGYYEIEDPGTVTLHKRKNQKIAWCVVYQGTTPPGEVVIDNFRSSPAPGSPSASNPFGDGSSGDNSFSIPSADFNLCRHGTKTPKATAEYRSYKYTITIRIGQEVRGQLDPVVIVDN